MCTVGRDTKGVDVAVTMEIRRCIGMGEEELCGAELKLQYYEPMIP